MNRDDRRKLPPGAGGPVGRLRQNQERLHVGHDHKTDAMKKGRRGTYP